VSAWSITEPKQGRVIFVWVGWLPLDQRSASTGPWMRARFRVSLGITDIMSVAGTLCSFRVRAGRPGSCTAADQEAFSVRTGTGQRCEREKHRRTIPPSVQTTNRLPFPSVRQDSRAFLV
jgi:hypothetical protein